MCCSNFRILTQRKASVTRFILLLSSSTHTHSPLARREHQQACSRLPPLRLLRRNPLLSRTRPSLNTPRRHAFVDEINAVDHVGHTIVRLGPLAAPDVVLIRADIAVERRQDEYRDVRVEIRRCLDRLARADGKSAQRFFVVFILRLVVAYLVQIVIVHTKVASDPARMNGCRNNVGIVGVYVGAPKLASATDLFERAGVAAFLLDRNVLSRYAHGVCAIFFPLEDRNRLHLATVLDSGIHRRVCHGRS